MKEVLLTLARAAIKSSFMNEKVDTSFVEEYIELQKQGASFVTLTQDGQLRGCIGSIIAHRPLLDDIIHNAKAAAFKDPRFMPLSEEEFERTKIEVSLLTPPQPLEYEDSAELKSKIRIGIDGVILKHNDYQATFLPQVWEELSEFELFFSHLCQKAGMAQGCLALHPEIYTYQVEKVKEN